MPAAPVTGGEQRPFAELQREGVYARPSDFILALMAALPEKERLTRDQTLFMLRFAQACDEVWEDEEKEPEVAVAEGGWTALLDAGVPDGGAVIGRRKKRR